MGEKCSDKFWPRIRLPRNSRDLLHAANLRHGTDGFTSPPKEGVLRIFSPLKIRRLRPGLNPRTWVPKASTLPLDHRLYPPGNIPGTHFCWRLSQPQGHSAAGGIMSMKNSNDTIGNQTRKLPPCSAVPQPITILFFTYSSYMFQRQRVILRELSLSAC